MIFPHWQAILRGEKTQTRRIVKVGETLERNYILSDGTVSPIVVLTSKARIKWAVGRTYAVQPGRGQKQIARIRITDIRQERLSRMMHDDAIAEGISYDDAYPCPMCDIIEPEYSYGCSYCDGARVAPLLNYAEFWDAIHNKPGERWSDDPLVWVLTFELVQADA